MPDLHPRDEEMKIDIPADILYAAGANAADVRLAVAVQFYADNRIDHADACRLAGATPPQFNKELLARGMSIVQYPLAASTHRRRRNAS
jgi:predicted HTH domain antitoxin